MSADFTGIEGILQVSVCESVQGGGGGEDSCKNNDEERMEKKQYSYRVKKWLEKAEWRLENWKKGGKVKKGSSFKLTD